MFSTNDIPQNETLAQESYASAMRRDDGIRKNLLSVLDDFSLLDETTGEFEETDWIA